MKRIVVPTDYSDCAEYALRAAKKIYNQIEADEIVVVHVVDQVLGDFYGVNEFNDALGVLQSASKDRLVKYTKEREEDGINLIPFLLFNAPIKALTYSDELRNTEIIVMGSHGAQGLREVLLGSTAEKVIRYAECPVLVIKSEVDFNPKRTLFVSNFVDRIRYNFRPIKELLEPFGSEWNLAYFITPEHFHSTKTIEKRIENFISENNIQNYSSRILTHFSIEEGLMELLEEEKYDLVVMMTHGYKGLTHYIKGSVAENVANHIEAPIITYKMP